MLRLLTFIFIFLGCTQFAFSQKTTISGKVTDAETSEGIPFASVFFKGTTVGVTTDFDGYYSLTTEHPTDTLTYSYVGYSNKEKVIQKGKTQNINVQLSPESKVIEAVEIVAGEWENPAWEILRNVMKNKKENDMNKLESYEYEAYNKIEVDIDNIQEKFKSKKVVREAMALVDSIEKMAGEDGNPLLPIFISESISKYYFNKNPKREKEEIFKTKVTGIALDDGSTVSQVIGSTYVQYNFYDNYLQLFDKDFVSPIADSWRVFYDYELISEYDTLEGQKCSRISFQPKRPEDLAFIGTMWITDSTYALRRIDVTISPNANLNFIEKIKVQQDLQKFTTPEGDSVLLPTKTRILMDLGEIKDDWAGMLIKIYTSNKNYTLNNSYPLSFFNEKIVVKEDATLSDSKYWQEHRHDSLTQEELNVYHMIDTIRNLPTIRSYIDIVDILYNGYKDVGKFGIGKYWRAFAYNNVENVRLNLQFKTNTSFSKRMSLWASVAYGFADERWKYGFKYRYIFKRSPWTEAGIHVRSDLQQVALFSENFRNSDNQLFLAFSYWGNIQKNRPFYLHEREAYFQTEVVRGFQTKLIFRNQDIDPIFDFEYYTDKNQDLRKSTFTNTEATIQTRISFREHFVQNDMDRYSMGSGDRPIFTFRVTMGLKDVLGSDFSYQKYHMSVDQTIRLGISGRSTYKLNAGYIPQTLPYPLLENHLGNQTYFYNSLSFNLMNYFEFVSDTYASLQYVHRFDGFLLNRIPLMRKLKWRAFGEANVLFGGVRQETIDLIPATDLQGNAIPGFGYLNPSIPYSEVSYGIENIFKVLRIQAIHRLTYLDQPNIKKFGIKAAIEIRL